MSVRPTEPAFAGPSPNVSVGAANINSQGVDSELLPAPPFCWRQPTPVGLWREWPGGWLKCVSQPMHGCEGRQEFPAAIGVRILQWGLPAWRAHPHHSKGDRRAVGKERIKRLLARATALRAYQEDVSAGRFSGRWRSPGTGLMVPRCSEDLRGSASCAAGRWR